MNKLYLALGMQMIGGIIAFFQLQGWMVWTDRPFLRSLSSIIFGVLSWWVLGEIPTLKTLICILLAIAIILIQITNLQ